MSSEDETLLDDAGSLLDGSSSMTSSPMSDSSEEMQWQQVCLEEESIRKRVILYQELLEKFPGDVNILRSYAQAEAEYLKVQFPLTETRATKLARSMPMFASTPKNSTGNSLPVSLQDAEVAPAVCNKL